MTASQAIAQLNEMGSSSYLTNSLFIFLAACLVFIMQAGFALLETGYTRSKNTANIWLKNLMDFCVGVAVYLAVGFGLQYGDDVSGLFGSTGFLNPFHAEMQIWADCVDMELNPYCYFFFQLAFCGATATIVSGAVAERFKFSSYLIVSAVMSGFVYPVASHWIWGGGWLSSLGMIDFAGTLAVHGIGGISALVCAAMVGPRIGKYNKDGSSNEIKGHSVTLVGLGAILLWFGWYGFNPGSELGMDSDAMYAAITSTIVAGVGGLGGLFFSWIIEKKPNVYAAFNGMLAALVAVCSTANTLSVPICFLLAIIASIVIYLSMLFIDRVLHIDDACGAGSLHFVSGIPGVLMAGLVGSSGLLTGHGFRQFGIQLLAEVSVFVFVAICVFVTCLAIKKTIGLRVSDEEQLLGMDISEHNTTAYDFLETEAELKEEEEVILGMLEGRQSADPQKVKA